MGMLGEDEAGGKPDRERALHWPCLGISSFSPNNGEPPKGRANRNSGAKPSCKETSYYHSFQHFTLISISSPFHRIVNTYSSPLPT